ncbi:MAG: nucleotidyltransferase [Pseudomonadales bacterium]|nr:nucleotidyltransferase [Pseudomonadales bacterium]
MNTAEMFTTFLDNLKIDNADQISLRYGEITARLNKKFRDTDSKEANSLQVGSYGRYTGIKGISDLDMLYIMPKGKWDTYKDGKQSQLLTDTKDAIKARYPKTDVRVDRLVVTVTYSNFHVEVQPVFEETDENDQSFFKYPDTYDGGSWKITKPRQEIAAMKEFMEQKNNNLRRLCKMIRAWKNKHGIAMGGLLIDTLAYNYLKSTDLYDKKGFASYGELSRDFFEYLKDQPNQNIYKALGSGQNVKVKKRFKKKAGRAFDLCKKAIDAEGKESAHNKWKKVYGKSFPAKPKSASESSAKMRQPWKDTEKHIEDLYPVDIKYSLSLDCEVPQTNGFRKLSLRDMLKSKTKLYAGRKITFRLTETDTPEPYSIYWKVLNRGEEAKNRDCIRGQIVPDEGYKRKIEPAEFEGPHLVECYVVKQGVIVARGHIAVPIKGNSK